MHMSMDTRRIQGKNNNLEVRSRNALVRVTFDNGESICYSRVLTTFLETLKRIPYERYNEIDLMLGTSQLVTRTVPDKYAKYNKPLGNGWFVITQSDSSQKYLQLRAIISKLHLNFKVELGYDFEKDKEVGFQHEKKPKQKLLVKLKNGEYIAGASTAEVYISTLETIGFEVLMRKGIMVGKFPLVVRTPVHNNYVEVGWNLYVYMPGSTDKKLKVLNIINAYFKAGLEIIVL